MFYVTAECTANEAFKHAGENIVFASGSPFENVDLGTLLNSLKKHVSSTFMKVRAFYSSSFFPIFEGGGRMALSNHHLVEL